MIFTISFKLICQSLKGVCVLVKKKCNGVEWRLLVEERIHKIAKPRKNILGGQFCGLRVYFFGGGGFTLFAPCPGF